ncbi:hypothetical protein EVAR_70476_1 [Eumeta japonica]|uniref:Uncharacterized protein n=1 Tax=Eumeta variegata TaxID=151549 RepID=A0A4C2A9N8_EUMVA|nr:hypothetical protein EVAR_70476_1 [Eumeta japonica]
MRINKIPMRSDAGRNPKKSCFAPLLSGGHTSSRLIEPGPVLFRPLQFIYPEEATEGVLRVAAPACAPHPRPSRYRRARRFDNISEYQHRNLVDKRPFSLHYVDFCFCLIAFTQMNAINILYVNAISSKYQHWEGIS